MIPAHIEHTFRAIDRILNGSPASADTANKSLPHGQKDVHHAGLGSVEAGTSAIVRYWTVKFERGGRTYWTAVEACDVLKANLVTFKKHEGASAVVVVREIQRDEYEALTRKSP